MTEIEEKNIKKLTFLEGFSFKKVNNNNNNFRGR